MLYSSTQMLKIWHSLMYHVFAEISTFITMIAAITMIRAWKIAVAIITGMQAYFMLSRSTFSPIKLSVGIMTVHTKKVRMN